MESRCYWLRGSRVLAIGSGTRYSTVLYIFHHIFLPACSLVYIYLNIYRAYIKPLRHSQASQARPVKLHSLGRSILLGLFCPAPAVFRGSS